VACRPGEVFDLVAHEVSTLLGGDVTHIVRLEPDGTATTLARWGMKIGQIPGGESHEVLKSCW
jgi:hypothetical protein